MVTEPSMGLKIWNNLTDPYDHAQLGDNWAKVGQHDHSNGKGVQIPTGGIADGAITTSKIATSLTTTPTDGSVSLVKLASDVTTDYGYAYSAYKNLRMQNVSISSGTVTSATTWLVTQGSTVAVAANGQAFPFAFDPADYAAGSRSTKLRLRVAWTTNGAASGITFTFGLYPVTSISAGVLTLGAVTSGSTVAIASPAINTVAALVNSGDFAAPTVGQYVLAFTSSGAMGGASTVGFDIALQVRQV